MARDTLLQIKFERPICHTSSPHMDMGQTMSNMVICVSEILAAGLETARNGGFHSRGGPPLSLDGFMIFTDTLKITCEIGVAP